ncbi:MAG TPA: NifU family protein [Longimicrobiales bacterium]|jgi:Fe-S cluster biogenesis protein NfuA|nr:NifU family protein [Longimicrobiales bacterium]
MSRRNAIEAVLTELRPALHADGGDVELVDFDEDDGTVRLRLLGLCESCPISSVTLKQGIERRLVAAVPGVRHVLAV